MGPVCTKNQRTLRKIQYHVCPWKLGLFSIWTFSHPKQPFRSETICFRESTTAVLSKERTFLIKSLNKCDYHIIYVVNINPTAIDWAWTKTIRCTVHSPVVLLRQGRRPKWHLGAWLGKSPGEEEKQFQQKGLETTGYMHYYISIYIYINHKYFYISYKYKSWVDIPQKQRDRQVKYSNIILVQLCMYH